MPPVWRPLKIRGEWQRGSVIVGDGEHVIFQVKWWRPQIKNFDGRKWMTKRLKRETKGIIPSENPPCPETFTDSIWACDATRRDGVHLMLWYGYARQSDLMLEVISGGRTPEHLCKKVEHHIIPSLRTVSNEQAMKISLFNRTFEVPAGFKLKIWKLAMGDISLRLESDRPLALLTMRQVYPAGLALQRRPIERWLTVSKFKEHRKFEIAGHIQPYQIEVSGNRLKGIRRCGRKRLPFPLGPISCLNSVHIGVHDAENNRLFFVEYDVKEAPADKLTEKMMKVNLAL